jgi:signal transduction histidine kinase
VSDVAVRGDLAGPQPLPAVTRRPLSISVRLALWFGLALLLLLSAFGAVVYGSFHALLHRDFDRHLQHEEHELLPYVVLGTDGPAFAGLGALRSVAYSTDGVFGTYVRLLGPGGQVRYRSPNFEGHDALPVFVPPTQETASRSRTWQGEPARTRAVPLRGPGGRLAGWLEVTGFEWSLHQGLHQLAGSLALGVLVCVALALMGGLWLARRALRPVGALRTAADQMSTADLSARLPAEFGTRDELTELAETFNGWLARLEASVARERASVERERRFSADAAHELLTPLAALRSEAEVALRRDRSAEGYREALSGVVAEAERLGETVQGLLRLARAERISRGADERADLAAVAGSRVEAHRAAADAKGVALTTATPRGPVWTAAAEGPLADVVDNLLQNAVKYTPPGGRVEVAVRAEGGVAVLVVTDTGVGMTSDVSERAFERFYRSDEPAVQAEPGSGLGLAVVYAVVEAYGGDVSAESAGPGFGSQFTVSLPAP